MTTLLFTDTVTIYNHHKNTWYKSVLENVQWNDVVTKTVDSDGNIHVTKEVSLTIPYRDGYVPPKEYTGEGFTFGLDNLDVIVLGNCLKEIAKEYTITDLRREYGEVATIYAVNDNTLRPLLKHWKVSAK